MPSFDVVNRVDLQEVENAVNNARKIISTRFDFRGSETEITLDKKAAVIHLATEDTMKLKAVQEELAGHLVKRGVSPKALEYSEPEQSGKRVKSDAKLLQGIDKDRARTIVKLIKDSKLKVQAQIQDEQVRVSGKKIDDLQAVIALLKSKDLGIPLQYVNMKS